MKVTYFQRHRGPRHFSLERLFDDVRDALPPEVEWRVAVSRYPSEGIAARLFNIVEAGARADEVNHVTGDVHFLVYLLPKRRTVLTILDCVSLQRLTGLRRAIFRFFWYTLPMRGSGLVTVISSFTKSELIRYTACQADRIRVIHVPLNSGFHPSAKEFKGECPTILYVGASQNKNLDRSAEALRGISCRLRIIGRLSPAQEAVLEHNRIDYSAVPSVSDEEMIAEYRNCDLVLFPSTYEGFGIPVIEGQATGRPVITSNICSMPEVAADGACLVDPFDVQSIRNGVLRVVRDPEYRNDLLYRGFANVKRFAPDVIAAQYVSVYRELLGFRD